MPLEPILVDGAWAQAASPAGSIYATNPANRERFPEDYPISGFDDLERMLEAACRAVVALRAVPPEGRAAFLEQYAASIEARREALLELAQLESALPLQARLAGELDRTTGQLRQAAQAARDRSWVHATIDTKANIRSMFGPLNGPVVVFGPNNFPLAFNSASGGDFAAAIAAGNPVIGKANPAHPGTTKMLAEAALEAIRQTGMPPALLQLFYHTSNENGLRLVSHPLVGATAFTGSKSGLHLKRAADQAGKPIYLEMSSVNPVFILPGALEERPEAIAGELFTSCTLGAGQFCTNPGLVALLDNPAGRQFIEVVRRKFEEAPPGVLFTERGPEAMAQGIQTWRENGAELLTGGVPADAPSYSYANSLLSVSGAAFLQHAEALQTEAFGVASLIVLAENPDQLVEIAAHLEGNLTGCFYSAANGQDDALYDRVEPVLRTKVGRLLNDKMPTGVAVSPAMVHGGPYPSTGHPGFTAVGIPAALLRFAALYSYDNVRPHRLPPELRDANPTGRMWRYIDLEWTRRSL